MKYSTAKATTFICVEICGIIYAFAITSINSGLEAIALTLMIALLVSTIIGMLVWGMVRIGFCEKYLDNTLFTKKDLDIIWETSGYQTYRKTMDLEMLNAYVRDTKQVVKNKIGFVGVSKDLHYLVSAAVLLRYTGQWSPDCNFKDKDLLACLKEVDTEINVLAFFINSR